MSYNMNGLINNDGSITKYGQTNSSTFPSSSVTYSNTSSGLSATTVQGAIDEVVEEMGSASMSATSGQSNQYTITDGSTSANFYNKTGVDTALGNYQPKVTASTTDLTPGTSSLTTGNLYVVYE